MMAELKGTVQINQNLCKGCGLCVAACPVHIIELAEQTVNAKGYSPATVTAPGECTGCGNCALMCPDSGITVKRFGGKGRRVDG
jgi:2-oxoglutarate ferredoxin oxidoreductase subunit delta